jgi:pteridine reductase
MDIRGKNVLITGGAVRVGAAITRKLALAGATVFCHFHSSRNAAVSLQKSLREEGAELHLLQADLSRVAMAEQLVDEVVKTAGRIDILVNNAAIFFVTPLGSVTEEEWDRLFALNLKSAFFIAQRAGTIMKQQGSGKIINICDTSGERPWPSFLPYSITKAGMISMTRGLAKALAPEVQVAGINPGPVMLPADYSPVQREQALAKTLLRREGNPADIAATVHFLIEGSDYITGAIFNIDGGRANY